MDLILYHDKCTDGFCAAYVAQKRFPGVRLLGAQFSTEPPYEEVEGKDVLVVDFSWKSRAENIKLNLLAKSFHILDHHTSSKALLEGLEFATFDESRSGAGLAWDYLFGKDCGTTFWDHRTGEEQVGLGRPWYVNYVEDYDTWKHKLPRSREINAYLHAIPKTIEAWDEVSNLDPTMAARFGIGAKMQIDSNARKLVEASKPGKGWGITLGVVNAPTFQASEVGEILAQTYDAGLIWWERADGIVTFSLRSRGDIDVSKIASKMGGGGHKYSAGFEVKGLYQAYELLGDILNRRPKENLFPCNLR